MRTMQSRSVMSPTSVGSVTQSRLFRWNFTGTEVSTTPAALELNVPFETQSLSRANGVWMTTAHCSISYDAEELSPPTVTCTIEVPVLGTVDGVRSKVVAAATGVAPSAVSDTPRTRAKRSRIPRAMAPPSARLIVPPSREGHHPRLSRG